MPDKKPWLRNPDERDPSRSITLDLQEHNDWKMDSTVLMNTFDSAQPLEDDMQVQCLPVYKPQWTYRTVPRSLHSGHLIGSPLSAGDCSHLHFMCVLRI